MPGTPYFTAAAGESYLLNPRVPHGSDPNPTDRRQRAMNVIYIPAGGVPLLGSRPGQRHDRHVHAPVGHVDIVPTVLDELGLSVPDYLQGTSLAPWLDGADPPPWPAFVEWTAVPHAG